MRRLVVAALLVALAACSGDGGNTVTMAPGRRFQPSSLTISAGETVTWVSDTDDAHTVTAVQGSLPPDAAYFASGGAASEDSARGDLAAGLLEGDETFEHTFDVPGTYEYYCIPHEQDGMEGTIVVEG